MTIRCPRCKSDIDDSCGIFYSIVLIVIGLVLAVGFFQICSAFRWVCGFGG